MTGKTEDKLKPQQIEKREVVKSIQEKLNKANAFYVSKFSGINVENLTTLRGNLRKSGSEMVVLKNTMVRLAIKEQEYASNFNSLLKGANAITFSYEEPSAGAKVLFDFAKKNKNLTVDGCIFDDIFYGPDEIVKIKDLPSRDALLSMIASVLNEPMAKLARTLGALVEKKEEA